jgi:hypothetical protein
MYVDQYETFGGSGEIISIHKTRDMYVRVYFGSDSPNFQVFNIISGQFLSESSVCLLSTVNRR